MYALNYNLMDGGIKFIRGGYQNVKHIISSFFLV